MRPDCVFAQANKCHKEQIAPFMCTHCSSFISSYSFIHHNWIDYRLLWDSPEKEIQQRDLLCSTHLREAYSTVFRFIPTRNMLELSSRIQELYSKLRSDSLPVEAICTEVYHSSVIEGCKASLADAIDIRNGRPLDKNNLFSEYMLLGGFAAWDYLTSVSGNLTLQHIVDAWNLLVKDCCDNEEIRGEKFRVGDVCVGTHTGTPFEHVEESMLYWLNYYNSEIMEDHPFIKAAILHFAFEYIHPFCDGNGRLGRLLVYKYLNSRGYLNMIGASFSQQINVAVSSYYAALDAGDNPYSDCTAFIEYFLDTTVSALETTLYGR